MRDFFCGKCPCGGAVEKNPGGEAQNRGGLRPSAAAGCLRPPLRRLVITAYWPPPAAPWKQAPGRDAKGSGPPRPEHPRGGAWLTRD
jgi:hypothetical protein